MIEDVISETMTRFYADKESTACWDVDLPTTVTPTFKHRKYRYLTYNTGSCRTWPMRQPSTLFPLPALASSLKLLGSKCDATTKMLI